MTTDTSLLLVDAGNLLFKNGMDANNGKVPHLAAHGIVRAYKEMSYDAVAVSSTDLNAGLDFFQTSQANGFPWISANIFDRNKQLLFRPYIIRTLGTQKYGIIGLTGKGETTSEGTVIGDWRDTLPGQVIELEKRCDFLLLLSNLTDEENREIAENYPQIRIIFSASSTKHGNILPNVVGDCLLTQSEGRGKYIGKLDVNWYPQGTWLSSSPEQSLQRLQNRLGSIDWQIKKQTERQPGEDPEFDLKLAKMQVYRQSIAEQIASLKTSIAQEKLAPEAINTFDSTFLPVKPSSSGTAVDSIVQDIKNNITVYQQARRTSQGAQMQENAGELLQLPAFTGISTCSACHTRQTDFWAATAHANAFTTLEKKGQSYNPDCLPCHVTGGSISSDSSYDMRNLLPLLPESRKTIGCEVCHGPGKQHSLAPAAAQLIRRPAKQICVVCHTPERDSSFDYDAKMVKTACPVGT